MQESEYSPQNGRSPCHFPRGPHTKLPILKESNGHRAGVNIDSILSETGAGSRMSLSPYCAIDNRCNPLRYACCAVENSCRAVGAKNVTYKLSAYNRHNNATLREGGARTLRGGDHLPHVWAPKRKERNSIKRRLFHRLKGLRKGFGFPRISNESFARLLCALCA